ncbi:hypothetical protein G9Q84_15010 [Pseudomonas sp. P7]|jgi:hypothetical protein|uniref:hypothetical protein n=1 Tax=Pseudomonas TaxID=286 RepID=UPI000BCFBE9B|nr:MULTISPECIES: hypothetical protein [Pseudomonas]MBA2924196.1 hypothetical protein [Pseudomonas sivasensis]OYT82421.1 MAG: hypothetical protein CFE48_03770 [Pseudomonas sp. PGPPP2]WLH16540.1 hypothetical protein PSH75_19435 [Pseudomonas simiae]
MNNQQRAALITAALQAYLTCPPPLKRFYRLDLRGAIQDALAGTKDEEWTYRAQGRCCPFVVEEDSHVDFAATNHLATTIHNAIEWPEDLFWNWWWNKLLTY